MSNEKEMLRFSNRVDNVIDSLNLPKTANKELLKLRFLDEVEFYEKKETIQRNSTIHLDF